MGQRLTIDANQGGDFAEMSGTTDGRQGGPGFLCHFGGQDGAVHIFDRAAGKLRDDLFGCGVDDFKRLRRRDKLTIDQHFIVFESSLGSTHDDRIPSSDVRRRLHETRDMIVLFLDAGKKFSSGFSGVVLVVVDFGMVFQRFEVGDDFSGHSQLSGQAFLKNRGEGVGFADRCKPRKKQVDFNDLAITRGSEADAVVLNVEFSAEGVEVRANFAAGFRVGIVEQPDRGLPDEAAA